MFSQNRIAVCHEWVTTFGGSEQVASRIANALDAEQVFTYTADLDLASDLFGDRPVTVISKIGGSAFARRRWQWLLPHMPRAWQRLDLSAFDVVVTSAHSCVNAIDAGSARHISYCHTPMRYAWQWRDEIGRIPLPLRPLWPAVAAFLRSRDRRWSRNVDVFVANSRNVADRIQSFYGRESEVVYPPIDTGFWTAGTETRGDYFLCAGRLVAYKRTDVAIRAARAAGVDLVVAGDGPEYQRLRRLARGTTTRFVRAPDAVELRSLYRRARALVHPGVEDFGMTLVESQACGTPVIAFAQGGALEAVIDGRTGSLYATPSVGALAETLRSFDPEVYDKELLLQHAARFGLSRFDSDIRRIVEQAGPQ